MCAWGLRAALVAVFSACEISDSNIVKRVLLQGATNDGVRHRTCQSIEATASIRNPPARNCLAQSAFWVNTSLRIWRVLGAVETL